MSRSPNLDLGIKGGLSNTVFGGLLAFELGVFVFLVGSMHCLLAEGSNSVANALLFVLLLDVLEEEEKGLPEFFLLVLFFFLMTRGSFLLIGSGRFLRFFCDCDPTEDEDEAPAAAEVVLKLVKSRPPAAASAASTAAATAS